MNGMLVGFGGRAEAKYLTFYRLLKLIKKLFKSNCLSSILSIVSVHILYIHMRDDILV